MKQAQPSRGFKTDLQREKKKTNPSAIFIIKRRYTEKSMKQNKYCIPTKSSALSNL
jgi:hypothetical protein